MGVFENIPPAQLKKRPHKNIIEEKDAAYSLSVDRNGNVDKEFICMAIDLPTVTSDIFTGEETYIFENPRGIKVIVKPSMLIPQKVIELADFGMEVTFFNSVYFVEYLLDLIYFAPVMPSYSKLGFCEYKGRIRFLWDKMYPVGLKRPGVYTGDVNISSKGTVKEWRAGIKQFVHGHYPLELMLACAFGAMVIGLIGRDRGIETVIVDFWGTSSTGKSSAAKVAASVYGSPNISDDSICSSWFSTGNSLIMSLVNLYGVLRIFDDSSSAIVKDLESMIYKIGNGKDKGRLNGDIQQVKSGSWLTLVITTGESPILDESAKQGAQVRAIEFNLQLTESAEHAQELAEFTKDQYGTAVTHFASKMLKIGKERILKRYDSNYKKLLHKLEDKPLNERLCKVYAVIIVAAQLINKVFNLDFNCNKIAELIIESNNKRRTKDEEYEELLDKVLAELSIHQKDIIFVDEYEMYAKDGNKISYDKAFRTPQKVIGVFDMRHGLSELSINRNVVDDILLKACNFKKSEVNNVYRYFKSKNYIKTYKEGFAVKRQLGAGGRIQCICFNAKVLFDGRQYESAHTKPSSLTAKVRKHLGGVFK